MTPECQAQWYAHTWSNPEPCRQPACSVVEGKHLCWTHTVTVREGLATLEEVLSGERAQPLLSPRRDDAFADDPYLGRFD